MTARASSVKLTLTMDGIRLRSSRAGRLALRMRVWKMLGVGVSDSRSDERLQLLPQHLRTSAYVEPPLAHLSPIVDGGNPAFGRSVLHLIDV